MPSRPSSPSSRRGSPSHSPKKGHKSRDPEDIVDDEEKHRKGRNIRSNQDSCPQNRNRNIQSSPGKRDRDPCDHRGNVDARRTTQRSTKHHARTRQIPVSPSAPASQLPAIDQHSHIFNHVRKPRRGRDHKRKMQTNRLANPILVLRAQEHRNSNEPPTSKSSQENDMPRQIHNIVSNLCDDRTLPGILTNSLRCVREQSTEEQSAKKISSAIQE